LWEVGRRGRFIGVRAVFVDGFADFTPPQLDLLETVAGTVDEVWISLVTDRAHDDARAELFARPLATLERLQRLKADQHILIRTPAHASPQTPARPAGLAHLERHLFRLDPTEPPRADAAGLSIMEAPGLLGEVRLLARAVKTLLLGGTAADDIL